MCVVPPGPGQQTNIKSIVTATQTAPLLHFVRAFQRHEHIITDNKTRTKNSNNNNKSRLPSAKSPEHTHRERDSRGGRVQLLAGKADVRQRGQVEVRSTHNVSQQKQTDRHRQTDGIDRPRSERCRPAIYPYLVCFVVMHGRPNYCIIAAIYWLFIQRIQLSTTAAAQGTHTRIPENKYEYCCCCCCCTYTSLLYLRLTRCTCCTKYRFVCYPTTCAYISKTIIS